MMINGLRNFRAEGRIGEHLMTKLFYITVKILTATSNGELYFVFRDKESLVADFSSRLGFQYVVEGLSVLEISVGWRKPRQGY